MNFIVEVHVAGGIDEVQLIFLTIGGNVGNADGLGLDGNAAFAFEIHSVKILLPRLTLANHLGKLKNAVGQG